MVILEVESNSGLVNAVNAAITESGYKKSYIADQLGMTRQNLSKMLSKVNFNINDAQRILEVIGYEIEIKLQKKDL